MQVYISASEETVEEWNEIVDEAKMNRSEWLRYQVQAGRAQLNSLDPRTENESADGLRTRVLEAVPDEGSASTEEIVAAVIEPIENDVYDLLDDLAEDEEITFVARENGFRRQ